jgi:hypothetical protein
MRDAGQRENGVPDWFTTRMTALFLLYPGRPQAPGTIVSWWSHLHDLPREKLEAAFDRAPQTSSLYVPTAQTIREIALALPRSSAPVKQSDSVASLPEHCKLAPDNPFRKLAESWEYESRELGLHPERVTPKHIAERRMAELLALLDGQRVGAMTT